MIVLIPPLHKWKPQVELSTLIFPYINGDFSTLIFQLPPSQLLYLGDKVSELQINEGRWMGFRFMEDSSYTMENETNLTATPKALSSSIHGIVEKWYRRFIFIQRAPRVFVACFGHARQIIEGTLVHMDDACVRAHHGACINLFRDVVRGKYQTWSAKGKSLYWIH